MSRFSSDKKECDITKDRENKMKRKLESNKKERTKRRCYWRKKRIMLINNRKIQYRKLKRIRKKKRKSKKEREKKRQ